MTISLALRAASAADASDVEDEDAVPTFRAWLQGDDPGRVEAGLWLARFPGEDSVIGNVLQDPASGDHLLGPLLEVAREQARLIDPALPLHVAAYTGVPKATVLAAAGGEVVRHFWRMTVPVPDVPAVPELPDGAQIRLAGEGDDDLRTMYDVLDPAFADHFGAAPSTYDEWVEFRSSTALSDRSLWWLATVDGEPAAGLIGRVVGTLGWIEEVGTLSAYRGRGLARALLLTAIEEFRRRGFGEVGLGVDATNPTGAVRLYSSIGMRRTRESAIYEFRP